MLLLPNKWQGFVLKCRRDRWVFVLQEKNSFILLEFKKNLIQGTAN